MDHFDSTTISSPPSMTEIDLAITSQLLINPFAFAEPNWELQQQLALGRRSEGETSSSAINGGGDDRCGGKMKKPSKTRFAFQTRSASDILDDGYRWRKYGQKAVKNSSYPRSYYRCTRQTCEVKKQVQRSTKDSAVVVTTYDGVHNHPCENLMEILAPLLKQIHLLSHF